jgi:hypothetical protein
MGANTKRTDIEQTKTKKTNRTKKRPTDTSISLLLVFMIHAHHVRSALHIPRQYYPAFPRMELFFGVDEHEEFFW